MGLLSRAPPRRRKDQSAYCQLLRPCITSAQEDEEEEEEDKEDEEDEDEEDEDEEDEEDKEDKEDEDEEKDQSAYCQLLRPCITSAQPPPRKNSKVPRSKHRCHGTGIKWYFYEGRSACFIIAARVAKSTLMLTE